MTEDTARGNLYRYKRDGCLYLLFYSYLPCRNLVAEPYFPGIGILSQPRSRKRNIEYSDFEVVATL